MILSNSFSVGTNSDYVKTSNEFSFCLKLLSSLKGLVNELVMSPVLVGTSCDHVPGIIHFCVITVE